MCTLFIFSAAADINIQDQEGPWPIYEGFDPVDSYNEQLEMLYSRIRYLTLYTARLEKTYFVENNVVRTPNQLTIAYKDLWNKILSSDHYSFEKLGIELIAYQRIDYPSEVFIITVLPNQEVYFRAKSFVPEDYGVFGDYGIDSLGPFFMESFMLFEICTQVDNIVRPCTCQNK